MSLNLKRILNSDRGRTVLSILLGLGLATLFRTVCKDNNCIAFHAPPLDDFKDKIYKNKNKCVQYVPVETKCSLNVKTVTFE